MSSPLATITQPLRQIWRGATYLPRLRLSSFRKVFSLMGRREKIALWILLGIAGFSIFLNARGFYYAHTISAPTFGGVYAEGMVGQPAYINPLLAHTDADLSLERLVYSGLYKYDGNGQLIPDLADGQPVISEDQKQYTINLKRNVKWHNDRSFTADDVVFTIQTLKDPEYKSPQRGMWLSTTVEKISDYQVVFTTKDVSGPFAHNLTLPILPQSVWGRVDPSVFLTSVNNLQAVGTGPYAIKEIKKQASGKVDQISLDSFSNYYGGKPKIDTLIVKFYDSNDDLLNAFHSKEVQGFGSASAGSPVVSESTSDTQVVTIPLPQYQVLFFNLANKTLSDQAVRQALAAAVNRQDIIDNIFKGSAILPRSPFTFSLTAQPSDSVVFDAALAAQRLDAAGWKVDAKTGLRTKAGKALQLTIITNDSLLNSKTAENIAAAWRSLNLDIQLTVLPTKQLTDTVIRPRSFDVLVFPLEFGADPDPFVFFHSSQLKDPGVNLTGFADAQADKLMTEARSTTNIPIREQKYLELSQLLTTKLPVLFLTQTEYFYAVDGSIRNISLKTLHNSNDRFYDISSWYMQEGRVWK